MNEKLREYLMKRTEIIMNERNQVKILKFTCRLLMTIRTRICQPQSLLMRKSSVICTLRISFLIVGIILIIIIDIKRLNYRHPLVLSHGVVRNVV